MRAERQTILMDHGEQATIQQQSMNVQASVLEATSKEVRDNWEAAEGMGQARQRQNLELESVNKRLAKDLSTIMDHIVAQQGAEPPGAKPFEAEYCIKARNTLDVITPGVVRASSVPSDVRKGWNSNRQR